MLYRTFSSELSGDKRYVEDPPVFSALNRYTHPHPLLYTSARPPLPSSSVPFLHFTDTACRGNAANTFVQGSSTSEVLAQLAARFCGCTSIAGNLAIQLSLQDAGGLTEDSFSSLYHLREISGYLHLSNIPAVTSITLPNLRVIRGQTTLSSTHGPVSLLVENSRIGSLNLPNLTEISNGGATFVSTSGMCGFLGVDWTDIMTSGQLDYSMSGCTNMPDSGRYCSYGIA